ncbi:MAG: hypothetical protein IJ093_01775, partial [Bacilli bacterium]|nr:hypothetical protein [Bacilli bacterium]
TKIHILDANTFNEKRVITLDYIWDYDANNNSKKFYKPKFSSVSYDKTTDRYIFGRGYGNQQRYTVCKGSMDFTNKNICNKEFYSSNNYISQGAESYDGYLYKTMYNNENGGIEGGTPQAVIDVMSSNPTWNWLRTYRFNVKQAGEIEGLDFVGNTPVFLFNSYRNSKDALCYEDTSDCKLAKVYVPVWTARNVNAKVATKVETNNLANFKNLSMSANFNSSNPAVNKNIAFAKNGYTLSNISIGTAGKQVYKIKQNTKTNSNWKFDTSTKTATITTKYSFSSNNLVYNVTFAKGDNTFKNVFTYSPISVPISVKVSTSKESSSLTNPSTKATLYKDGKKIETVTVKNGKYTFKNLTFKGKGTYKYQIKQENSGKSKSGAVVTSIDSSIINLTVKVTESTTKLEYKNTYSKNTFTNKMTYDFEAVNNTIDVKIKTNRSDSTVPIPVTSASIMNTNNKVLQTKQSSDGQYSFNVKVSSPGTHKFTIVQDTGLKGEGIYAYTIDKTKIVVNVVAKIDGDKLKCTIKFSNKDTFTNKVTANYKEISVTITTQVITNTNDNNVIIPSTSAIVVKDNKNVATLMATGGVYTYTDKINKVGTYKYTIYQKNDATLVNNAYTYEIDDKRITYTVKVTSNNGVLSYNITPINQSFTNAIYANNNVSNVSLSVNIDTQKSGNGISTPVTSATLYNSDDEVVANVNSVKNKYTFKNLTFDSPGTYVYTIKQDKNGTETTNKLEYDYDSEVITATIDINDYLEPSISYSKNSFINSITANYDSLSIPINAFISNSIDDKSITPINTSASLYLSDTKISTVNNVGTSYNFAIEIGAPGEYDYQIKQENSGVFSGDDFNYSIDDDIKTCHVVVYEEDGSLKYTLSYNYDDNQFENNYVKKYDVLEVPVSIPIITNKSSKNVKSPTISAVLIDDEEVIETVNSNNDSYTFDEVNLLLPGTYIYEIKQEEIQSNKLSSYKYDIDDRTITVEVNVKEENGKLVYDTSYDDENGFVNTITPVYEAINIPLEVSIDENKEDVDSVSTSAMVVSETRVLDKASNKDSKYTFNNVKLDQEGTFTFKIVQIKPYDFVKNGVLYDLDDSVITATVTTTDVDGKLTYSVVYSTDKFTNKFKSSTLDDDSFVSVPISIDIFSNSDKINDLKIDATLYENDNRFESGLPVETVNNSNSIYSFVSLNLLPGTYTYKILQNDINDQKWDIDDYEIELSVVVSDDLTYTISFNDEVSSFTNEYVDDVLVTSEENEGSPVQVVDVPNTAKGINIVYIISGALLVIASILMFAATNGVNILKTSSIKIKTN